MNIKTWLYRIFFQCTTLNCNSDCSQSEDFLCLVVSLVRIKREAESSSTSSQSIRIIDRARPYLITQKQSSTAPPTSPLWRDNNWVILHQINTLVINLWGLYLQRTNAKPTQQSLIGVNAVEPHIDPTLFKYGSSIVILVVRRSWYHTRVCFAWNRNNRGKSYVLIFLSLYQISHWSLASHWYTLQWKHLKEIVVNPEPKHVDGMESPSFNVKIFLVP